MNSAKKGDLVIVEYFLKIARVGPSDEPNPAIRCFQVATVKSTTRDGIIKTVNTGLTDRKIDSFTNLQATHVVSATRLRDVNAAFMTCRELESTAKSADEFRRALRPMLVPVS